MPPSQLKSDKEALQAAAAIQEQSRDALARVEQSLQETEQTAAMTLDDLYEQRRQLDRVQAGGERLHEQLDETSYLQSKLGSWMGGKKKKTYKKSSSAASEKENTNQEEIPKKKKKMGWKLGKSSKKTDEETTSKSTSKDSTPTTIGYLEKETTLYKGASG